MEQETTPRVTVVTQYDNTPQDTYSIELSALQPMVKGWISSLMMQGNEGTPEAANLSRLMKAAVKGVLIMYGSKMLKVMLGDNHPKPPKGCDIVEWYTEMFANIALAVASKQEYIVDIKGTDGNVQTINGFYAKPLPTSEQNPIH